MVGSNTTSYSWDFENRLSSVTLPGTGGTVSFKYDPFGRRIYKSSSTGTSVFVYDGDNLVEETNAAGAVVARYTQTNNIDEPVAMLRSGTTSYYQADGIGVQLLQFLPFLAPAVNIEVVKSGLPESRQTRVSAHEWQPQLRVRNPPVAFPQVPRDALLQRFQRHRWRNLCRLADQKMHVVRHHHVPHQQQVIPLANLSEGMYKQVSRTNRPQQGQLPVTAKGDKVQITPAVIALQLLGHSQIQSPTCNSWHLAHGNSANFHQWKVPVPKEWWAYTRQGTLIVSKMQKSADLDSHVIVSDLPDKKSYDEDKFKRSLIENYISGKEYRFLEERKTRLGDHEGYCLFFPSVSNTERLLVACEIPDYRLSVNFVGDRAYISNFNLILRGITRKGA